MNVTAPSPAPTIAPEAPAPVASAPTDADGDGVLAGDACPEQPETKNGFKDDDGCPDEVPEFYVSGNDVLFTGELKFGLLNGLLNSSQPVVDGIAALLADQGDVELVEVAVHVADGSDADKKSTSRAKAVVKALGKAGVDTKRLRAVGYGKLCTGGDKGNTRVALKVIRKGGKDTGVALCAK